MQEGDDKGLNGIVHLKMKIKDLTMHARVRPDSTEVCISFISPFCYTVFRLMGPTQRKMKKKYIHNQIIALCFVHR